MSRRLTGSCIGNLSAMALNLLKRTGAGRNGSTLHPCGSWASKAGILTIGIMARVVAKQMECRCLNCFRLRFCFLQATSVLLV